MAIKNIIFDLGGVILDIDPPLTIRIMREFNPEAFDRQSLALKNDPMWGQYEKGAISSSEFIEGIRKYFNPPPPETVVEAAWNAMIIGLPGERLDLLLDLKKSYRTFLMSNTNAMHLDHYNGILKSDRGIDDINSFFEKAYYSHTLHMAKPDPRIFQHILEENNLKPQETLFVDDVKENTYAAAALGICTWNLRPPQTVMEIYSQLS
jgi:glucose-1-phosphatase